MDLTNRRGIKKGKTWQREKNIKVMSFNVRWDNNLDKKHSWQERKKHVASMIRFHNMDLVGLQEPIKEQMQDLFSFYLILVLPMRILKMQISDFLKRWQLKNL